MLRLGRDQQKNLGSAINLVIFLSDFMSILRRLESLHRMTLFSILNVTITVDN